MCTNATNSDKAVNQSETTILIFLDYDTTFVFYVQLAFS